MESVLISFGYLNVKIKVKADNMSVIHTVEETKTVIKLWVGYMWIVLLNWKGSIWKVILKLNTLVDWHSGRFIHKTFFRQIQGIDYGETFSQVVRYESIRVLFALAT